MTTHQLTTAELSEIKSSPEAARRALEEQRKTNAKATREREVADLEALLAAKREEVKEVDRALNAAVDVERQTLLAAYAERATKLAQDRGELSALKEGALKKLREALWAFASAQVGMLCDLRVGECAIAANEAIELLQTIVEEGLPHANVLNLVERAPTNRDAALYTKNGHVDDARRFFKSEPDPRLAYEERARLERINAMCAEHERTGTEQRS